jgi:hypothetical protein
MTDDEILDRIVDLFFKPRKTKPMIFYEDCLSVCEECGSDELSLEEREVYDPTPSRFYDVLICRDCGANHTHIANKNLARSHGYFSR